MEFDAIQWHDSLINNNTIHSYRGTVDSDVVGKILEDTENKLLEKEKNRKIRKRCYNVLVEAIQNLYHHAECVPSAIEKKFGKNFAVFAFTSPDQDTYKVSLGNYIKAFSIRRLKERMDQINHLSKDELKILYKLILNNDEFSEKGGGGLGIIDMARRTGNKLEYGFHKYNEEYYFFSLEIVIS